MGRHLTARHFQAQHEAVGLLLLRFPQFAIILLVRPMILQNLVRVMRNKNFVVLHLCTQGLSQLNRIDLNLLNLRERLRRPGFLRRRNHPQLPLRYPTKRGLPLRSC